MRIHKLAQLHSPQETAQFAARFAPLLVSPLRIYLSGVLGAGKTFWVQALLNALGERQYIPSPSYALVYSYFLPTLTVHHFDCYRLQGDSIGEDLLELLEDDAVCLLEWHEHAAHLPAADLYLRFDISEHDRREVYCQTTGDKGRQLYDALI